MRKWMFLPILFLLLVLMTGCGVAREINDMAVVSGVAFDWNEEEKTYQVTAEVVNREAAQGAQAEPLILDGKGLSPKEALVSCSSQSSRRILWSHARVFVLSEAAAEKGLAAFVEMILEDEDLRLSTELLIADLDSAAEIWEVKTDATDMIGLDLDDMIHEARERGSSPSLKAYHAKMLLDTEEQVLIPTIGMDKRKNAAITGALVFQGGKLVDRLTKEEAEKACR